MEAMMQLSAASSSGSIISFGQSGQKNGLEFGRTKWENFSCLRKKKKNNGNNVWCSRTRTSAELVHAEAAAESSLAEAQPAPSWVNGYGCSSSSTLTSVVVSPNTPLTGGALDFKGANEPLTFKPLTSAKKIVLVRHGLSTWNEEGRVQGSSDGSVLSEAGIIQVKKCRDALSKLKFDACLASPISRAKSSAELIWNGRDEPLIFLDTLREANLHFLEGMRNVDAKEQYPQLFRAWREDPLNFHFNGTYPVIELWKEAKKAWEEIMSTPGELLLVVSHKSMLRALFCTALGLGPDKFRSIDIHNCGVSVFTVNPRGEPMLQTLNMTSHLHCEVYY